MRMAMIGLGTMGLDMTRRLIGRGHEVVAYDLDEQTVLAAVSGGARGVVDGGNSRYTDSLDDPALLSSAGIAFCDVGVSGGQWVEA